MALEVGWVVLSIGCSAILRGSVSAQDYRRSAVSCRTGRVSDRVAFGQRDVVPPLVLLARRYSVSIHTQRPVAVPTVILRYFPRHSSRCLLEAERSRWIRKPRL